jgi:hypothetical protein
VAPPRPSAPPAGGGPPGLADRDRSAAAPLVIDLGLRPAGAAETDPGDPDPAGPGLSRAGTLRGAGVLLAVVAVLASPAAQPVPEPRLELLYRLAHTGHGFAVGEESLYELVATPTGQALTAHRLGDGAHRWTVPVGTSGESTWVEVAGDVPIVTGHGPAGGDPAPVLVHALDPRSGRVRWSRPGSPGVPAARSGGEWLAMYRELPGGGDTLGPSAVEVSAVHIASGRALWSFRTEAGALSVFDREWPWTGGQPPGYITTLAPDGLLARHHLATGTEVARVDTAAVRPDNNHLQLAGGMIFLWHGPDTQRRLAVYDAATLAHRWTLVGLGTGGNASDCRPVVCLSHDGPEPRLDGLDPATGRVVWSVLCADRSGRADFCYTEVRPLPAVGGLAVRYEPRGRDGQEASSVLLDPATGRRVRDLYGWFPLWPVTGPDQVLYRVEPTSWRTDRSSDLIRLGRLRAGLAGIEALGTVRAGWCDRTGSYVICAIDGVQVEVWHIR